MLLPHLLAIAIIMNGASAPSISVLQDTTQPQSAPQNPAPAAAEPAKGDAQKSQSPAEPAKASEETKKPDDSKKRNETTKPAEAENSAPANNQPAPPTPARKNGKPLPASEPHKVVIRRGGALEPNARISPDIPVEEALKKRQRAEEMLVAAEDRLRILAGRTLEPPQQETTLQIRNYMEKARSALRDGDAQRGHTLALKAYLLADDLVKH